MNLVCKAAGKKWEIRTLSPCRQLELPRDLASGTAVEVRNNGKSDIYLQLVMKGQPATGEIYPPSSEGLEMNIRFLTPEGQPLEVSSLEQGTDFLAAIRVKHPGIRPDYHNLALSIVFPSGWEIHNQRLFGGEGKLQSSPFVYQDIRDDRVDFFFDLKKNQEVIYYVLLNASYTGRYFMPPAACEAMYDAGVYARSSGQWVEVSP